MFIGCDTIPACVGQRDKDALADTVLSIAVCCKDTDQNLVQRDNLSAKFQTKQEAQLLQRYPTMCETTIQGHSRSSVVVPINVAYMTSC